ncbi:MAG: septal ring lytic transglycosylase RlpA family protein [Verrucomicrobiales bacterium]|nr:septal ring lytic transglycosylase RlpA family protein [Verrucomicrobiales bacterium]
MSIRNAFFITLIAGIPASCKTIPEPGRQGYHIAGQAEEGMMSWYSVKTNGGTETASGERFSNSAQTAAHKTLPMGTMVKVTNLANGRSEVVRINDRGPFTPGRVVDVSIGVAGKLDFVGRGVAPCRVEVVEPIGQGAVFEAR